MEIFTLLETIEDLLDNSRQLPFSNKSIVDKDEISDIIREIRLKLPDELKQAKWVKEERTRIIQEAEKEADDIVKEAENRIIAMIDEHEITKKAYDEKQRIIESANEIARQMSEGTKEYADNILGEVEETIFTLKNNIEAAQATIDSAISTIKNNRKELK
jgi:cell division septum initiation protein DivIVA